jgi:hypothetical protein
MLERMRGKPARCVLRRLGGGDPVWLPGGRPVIGWTALFQYHFILPDLIDFAGSTKLHCGSSCSS